MTNRFRYLLWLLLLSVGATAQVQYVTEKPRVEDVNDPDVTIRRIELTDRYTILYMTFYQPPSRRQPQRPLPFPYGELQGGSTINFEPGARLYANDGASSFKFIRAENIPTDRRRDVVPGVQVDFVAYFERLTPGITVFDLFECSDRNRPGSTCFNFWGVHVINPVPRTTAKRPAPRPSPPVATTPRPQQPRYTPRTTPGVATPGVATPEPSAPPTPAPAASAGDVALLGTVRSAKTKKPLAATVTYQLLSGAESAGEAADSIRTNGASGTYRIPAQTVATYAVTASAKGYFSQTDTLTTRQANVTRNFDLVPIEAGSTITLRNIYFNVSKYDLRPESFPELDRLVTLLTDNPTMTIRLEGHTDIVGDFDANLDLSRNRVAEVKRYLVGKGIGAGRIEVIGYGASRPINTNRTLKERPENRRVELVIVRV